MKTLEQILKEKDDNNIFTHPRILEMVKQAVKEWLNQIKLDSK